MDGNNKQCIHEGIVLFRLPSAYENWTKVRALLYQGSSIGGIELRNRNLSKNTLLCRNNNNGTAHQPLHSTSEPKLKTAGKNIKDLKGSILKIRSIEEEVESTDSVVAFLPIVKRTVISGPVGEDGDKFIISIKSSDKEFEFASNSLQEITLWAEQIANVSKKSRYNYDKKGTFHINLQFNQENESEPLTINSARDSLTVNSARDPITVSSSRVTAHKTNSFDVRKTVSTNNNKRHSPFPKANKVSTKAPSRVLSLDESESYSGSEDGGGSDSLDNLAETLIVRTPISTRSSNLTTNEVTNQDKLDLSLSDTSSVSCSSLEEISVENYKNTIQREPEDVLGTPVATNDRSKTLRKKPTKTKFVNNTEYSSLETIKTRYTLRRESKKGKDDMGIVPPSNISFSKFRAKSYSKLDGIKLVSGAYKSDNKENDSSYVEDNHLKETSEIVVGTVREPKRSDPRSKSISSVLNSQSQPSNTTSSQPVMLSTNSLAPHNKKTTAHYEEDPEQQITRKHIVTEILSTEHFYVENLELAVHFYKKALEQMSEVFNEPVDSIRKIFLNMDGLLAIHSAMRDSIQSIVKNWTSSALIGPIFEESISLLKMYTTYSSFYSDALRHYNELMKRNAKFAKEIMELRERSGSQLKLTDMLIMPIQRIPRYELLLTDLMKNTSQNHPDYDNIRNALQLMSNIALTINEEVRRTENLRRVEELVAKGIRFNSLMKPNRQFLKEMAIKVIVESTLNNTLKPVKEVQIFLLFSDILVHIKKDILRHGEDLDQPQFLWPLNLVWVINDGTQTKLFGPNECLTITDSDGEMWATYLDEVVQTFNNNLRKTTKFPTVEPKRYGEFLYPQNQGFYKGDWVNGRREGKGIFIYKENVYKGEWKNDKQHGKGICSYSNGYVYKGYWKEGSPSGKGQLSLSDGSKYVGHWQNGLRHGKGSIFWSNGDFFRGHWKHDRMSGSGIFQSATGWKYEGTWEDSLFHGRGTLILNSGLKYVGEFSQGVKQGQGTIIYPSGSTFCGQFEKGKRCGNGVFFGTDGSKYDGQWHNDMAQGQGTKEWPDGTKYQGQWMRGYRNGFGKCKYSDGTFYEGYWSNDQRHGEGFFRDLDLSEYKGLWANGFKEGKGVLTYSNGASIKGNFHNGLVHKNAVYTGGPQDSILTYEGEWSCGRFQGKGQVTFTNGDAYKGSFKSGSFHGTGTYTYSNGSSTTGKWTMGSKDNSLFSNLYSDLIPSTNNTFEVIMTSTFPSIPLYEGDASQAFWS